MLIDVTDPESIKLFLKSCSTMPGIYQMLADTEEILYVGKAKNLAKRLSSYFNKSNQSPKVAALVKQIRQIQTTITNSEAEALILECNLIKQLKPKYNILLRDDKSYPYICLSRHKYPRLFLYRGKKLKDALSYGPYPNAYAAKQTIRLLQQVFKLRVCTDSYFKNRTRACLLYQINRCSAPCVETINESDYNKSLVDSKMFLDGKSTELITVLANKMEIASEKTDYEQAAVIRDQIQKLQQVTEQQHVEVSGDLNKDYQKDIDIIAFKSLSGYLAIAILRFRSGSLSGSNEYTEKVGLDLNLLECSDDTEDLLISSLSQYYLNFCDRTKKLPVEIVTNYNFASNSVDLLSQIVEYDNLKVISYPRSIKKKWLDLALKNADELLQKKAKTKAIYTNKFKELTDELGLDKIPNSIECFDVSHTFGKQTIASCVIFDHNGPDKQSYRKYNISHKANGDDLYALGEALSRRYKKIVDTNVDKLPDCILIDGGKNQLNVAKKVISELAINKNIALYSITKGEGRRAIFDRIISSKDMQDVSLKDKSAAKILLQELRDEAHRFAITGHRAKRSKDQLHSSLEDIPGIGAKRRKNLLTYLGGWQQIKEASIDKLATVPGISKNMAEMIYDYLHR